jgi:hypothetical protein
MCRDIVREKHGSANHVTPCSATKKASVFHWQGGERRNASEITFQFRIGHFLEPESAFDSKNRAKGFPKAMPWSDIWLGLRPEWFS